MTSVDPMFPTDWHGLATRLAVRLASLGDDSGTLESFRAAQRQWLADNPSLLDLIQNWVNEAQRGE